MEAGALIATLSGAATALGGVVTYVMKAASSARRDERSECDKRVAALETRLTRLEASEGAWRDRWALEVAARTRSYNSERPPAPMRPPLPSFAGEEPTGVRNLRTLVEETEREKLLSEYLESKR